MAVEKCRGQIPKDAVRLTEREAQNMQWELIRKWTPKKDVWPFSYGLGVLSSCSALSAAYINHHYRTILHLGAFGRASTYLPIVAIPSGLSALLHQQFIASDILIQKTECPACLQMKAAGLQLFLSTVFPLFLSPISGFMFATRHYTYNMPRVTDFMGHVKLWQKLTRPVGKVLFFVSVFQAFLSMGVTYLEVNSFYTVVTKLNQMEENLP